MFVIIEFTQFITLYRVLRSQLWRDNRRRKNEIGLRHAGHGQRGDGEQRQNNRLERR